jgi:DNA-binding transcriptional regulator YdaS (Cro superfamily)
MTRSERITLRLRQEFGAAELANRLGITAGAIYQWKRVPEKHVAAVAKLTRMPAHELRPDLFKTPARKRA